MSEEVGERGPARPGTDALWLAARLLKRPLDDLLFRRGAVGLVAVQDGGLAAVEKAHGELESVIGWLEWEASRGR